MMESFFKKNLLNDGKFLNAIIVVTIVASTNTCTPPLLEGKKKPTHKRGGITLRKGGLGSS